MTCNCLNPHGYDYGAHVSSERMTVDSIIVAVVITLISAGVIVGGCKTAAGRHAQEIRAKEAHKAAFQKPPLPESATVMWVDEHWKDVLKTGAGALALALIRKGRKGQHARPNLRP